MVTLLHQFLRVRSLFPVLASSLRCSSTTLTDDRLMPVSWRWGAGGRVRTVRVGLCRVEVGSGQSGQFSLFWSFALDFEHSSLVSLLGTGQLTFLQGPCFAFRFPASGRHGLMMMTRSQQCLFVFWHQAIISLILMRLSCRIRQFHEVRPDSIQLAWRRGWCPTPLPSFWNRKRPIPIGSAGLPRETDASSKKGHTCGEAWVLIAITARGRIS